MTRHCYLVRQAESVLAVIVRGSAQDCGYLLQLDICFATDCGFARADQAHIHIPDRVFGQPRPYPSDDINRAGFFFREGRLPEIATIRWELYHESDPEQVLYLEPQRLIV